MTTESATVSTESEPERESVLETVRRARRHIDEYKRGPSEYLYEPIMEALLAAGLFRQWPTQVHDIIFVSDNHHVFSIILALVEQGLLTGKQETGTLALRTTHALCEEYGDYSIVACLAPEGPL